VGWYSRDGVAIDAVSRAPPKEVVE